MADASLCVCVVCSVFGTLLSAACATERFAHLKRGITRSIVPSMKSYIYPQKYGRILQRPPVFGALPPFAPPARRWARSAQGRALRFAPARRSAAFATAVQRGVPRAAMESAALHLSSLDAESAVDFFSALLAADTTKPSSDAAHCALQVFREAAQRGLTADQLEAELCSAGLSEALSAAAGRSWSLLGAEAHRALAASAIDASRLVDAEWTFGVTASSSEHSAVGTTYVQLRLAVAGPRGLEYEHMELSLPRFYEFVHDLERAKAQLDLI